MKLTPQEQQEYERLRTLASPERRLEEVRKRRHGHDIDYGKVGLALARVGLLEVK